MKHWHRTLAAALLLASPAAWAQESVVDSPAGATDTGIPPHFIRDDSLATLTPADGDYVQGRVNDRGALWVAHDGAVDTELPAGVTPADNQTNAVTIPLVGGFNYIFDGATWDRWTGAVTISGTPAVTVTSGNITADSELPAVETPADNLTNATAAPRVNALGFLFDGTTWDRAPGNSSTGMLANIGSLGGNAINTGNGASGTGVQRVTLASDSTGNIATIGTSVTPGTAAANLGKAEDAAHTSADTGVYALAVRDDSPAAHSGTDGDYESLHVSAEGGAWVTPTPSALGGLSIFRSLDIDETEEEIKGTAGTVHAVWVTNTATATRWLKFYNDTAANVSVGTTTPVITIGIPGNSADDIAGALAATGIQFSTAITVAATTGVADADTGAPGANDVIVNVFFK